MRLLILTNLYPPQELGGYGRSMADFAWALRQRGHSVQVLSSDAPYLGPSAGYGPSGEAVDRRLQLKGTYHGGVQPLQNRELLQRLNHANQQTIDDLWQRQGPFDGVLVGNIDLLGVEVLQPLLNKGVKVLHHIGFVHPPFPPELMPRSPAYQLVGASQAVRSALVQAGLGSEAIPVVYPGVRCELFGFQATGRRLPAPLDGERLGRLGTPQRPLKVCFAGLLMGSKGAHTLIEALILMKQQGFSAEGYLAGGPFQEGYRDQLESLLKQHGLEQVVFLGQLERRQLARCFGLHHVCVFPSIHPEAFGIVGAEAMASGLALVSSAVGGAAEVFEPGLSGLAFQPGNASDLAKTLITLCLNPERLVALAANAQARARAELNVLQSAQQLEKLLQA